MHCLSSSICFWIWTIFRETIEALANADYGTETTTTDPGPDYAKMPHALPLLSYGRKGKSLMPLDKSSKIIF